MIAKEISPKTRMIVHNSPHNPSGHVSSEAELRAISALCVKHNLIALSDEVYEHTVCVDWSGGHRCTLLINTFIREHKANKPMCYSCNGRS
jgi:aspartate/methionine/tyrosine aminotransferase